MVSISGENVNAADFCIFFYHIFHPYDIITKSGLLTAENVQNDKGAFSMNLLNLLTGAMTTDDSVKALSKRSGADGAQLGQLISLALPLLLQGMTNNASSQGGASSLLSALGQHTSTAPMSSQIQNADLGDGAAILSHIFGGNLNNVTGQLSQQTGLTNQQVGNALSSMAPGVLSGLSAATQTAQNQQQVDLSGLMQLFGGQPVQQQQSSGIGNLFGSLLGGGQAQQQTQQSSGLGSLLGSLLGGGQQQVQQQSAGFDGSSLLSLLLRAKK